MQVFQKWPGCALIGACALIRTNMVSSLQDVNEKKKKRKINWFTVQFTVFVLISTHAPISVKRTLFSSEINVHKRTPFH